jgi:alanyl-tRNA synthetase
MTVSEIRTAYLDFFKKQAHAVIPSASLIPENDPTTLFTGSGMQPLLPFLLGEKHPQGNRLTNSQKSFRAEDIEEVGDNRHTTFFEMLGNWSLGDYFKQEQLPWFFEFLTDVVGLSPEKLYVSVFSGDDTLNIPRDTESVDIWKKLFAEKGIEVHDIMLGSIEEGAEKGMQGGRIFYYNAKKNWWSRSGTPDKMPAGEPGGPDSEVFFDFGTPHDPSFGKECHPNCDCGRFMEIGNSVFMEYIKQEDGSFAQLPQKNVDFGGGLERIATASLNSPDVFSIDVFKKIIDQIESFSGQSYAEEKNKKAFRVIADHIRGAVFMIGDGVLPSNTEQGYFVRRLIRRAVRFADSLQIKPGALAGMATIVSEEYRNQYPILGEKAESIAQAINEEENRFRQTLEKGVKEFNKLSIKDISGKDAFILFTTYGFPFELTEEMAREKGIEVNKQEFDEEMKKHQDLSRAGAEQKFKGGLADTSEETTKLHTATHLLLAGLRKFVGSHVHQAGSNITGERLRFDFTNEGKVEREVLDKVEQYVNDAISAGAERTVVEMKKEDARAAGVEGSFWEKYPEVVKVYLFKSADGTVWSHELCGGPHVENTNTLGHFKIVKEESVSAGTRRIKAVLE